MSSLQGKVAIVTGGTKGIGRSIAIKLAAQGAHVVINYASDTTAAEDTVKTVGADRATAIQCDASSTTGIQKLVDETVAAHGKIDILIPNAGVLMMRDLEGTTEEDFDRSYAVNVKGPYFLAQKAAPHMSAGGHIIFVSTSLCAASTVTPAYLLYVSTKGAIEQMVRVMSKDLARRGISVNAVAPGPTGTDLFLRGKPESLLKTIASWSPYDRIGTPDEVADVFVYLSGSQSQWVTGQVLRANGGMA